MGFILALCVLASPTATVSVRGGVAQLGGEKDRDRPSAMAGLAAVWQSGPLLLGASFDGSSRVDSLFIGDVRHLFFAALGGGSFPLTDRLNVHLVAELGAHRVSGTRFGPRLVAVSRDPNTSVVNAYNGTTPAWAPFVGFRPSLELMVAPFSVGLALWGRYDFFQASPEMYIDPPLFPNTPGSPLNALSFGLDLHLGFRFD